MSKNHPQHKLNGSTYWIVAAIDVRKKYYFLKCICYFWICNLVWYIQRSFWHHSASDVQSKVIFLHFFLSKLAWSFRASNLRLKCPYLSGDWSQSTNYLMQRIFFALILHLGHGNFKSTLGGSPVANLINILWL